VPVDASGSDVLAAVAQTRVDKGLTCGVDGYPAKGCGDPVNEVSADAKAPDEQVQLAGLAAGSATSGDKAGGVTEASGTAVDDGGGMSTGAWVGVGAVVLVVLIGAAALLRRRGSAD
jgi:hypothetical protein